MKEKKQNSHCRKPIPIHLGKIKTQIEHWQIISLLLAIYDLIVVNLSYFLALWFRFDCRYSMIPTAYMAAWIKFIPIYSVFCLVVFGFFKLYKTLWQYASYYELKFVILSSLITSAFNSLCISLLFHRMPVSYHFVGAGLQFVCVLSIRFAYRFLRLDRDRRLKEQRDARTNLVMLIGAGSAGQIVLRDLHHAKECNDRVCCIIDDDSNKWGRYIDGVPIVGGRDDILLNVQKYKIEKIYLAIPSASAEERRDILNICQETDCELKILPGVYQFINGSFSSASALKKVSVEDLLGREPVSVNMEEVFQNIQGKVILVTGGGGSIGSELCRQIAKHSPKQLIIFDMYENNAHAISLELKDRYPHLNLVTLIGSVRDSKRISQVFVEYKPQVVYHAAAHKHVPLMEDSPCEAIKNNAIGTYKTAYAAMMNGCQRFVLISTDKAVNPVNVMGASKRLCEMIIQSFDRMIRDGRAAELHSIQRHIGGCVEEQPLFDPSSYPTTKFVAVRFGNVLGSNGSVIPRFQEQIAKGGPVTVTHPDIIRYFMTIPEAASLVLQAGNYADGGEIFVLDMGTPVKIDTLARNLIKLSGLRPDVDIQIAYTGLRPGEKLYEEKLMAEEGLKTTPNHLIHIGCPIPFDVDEFLKQLPQLLEAAYEDRKDIRTLIQKVVPTYVPAPDFSKTEEIKKQESLLVS